MVEFHYRWHPYYGSRFRHEGREDRANGAIIRVESPPKTVIRPTNTAPKFANNCDLKTDPSSHRQGAPQRMRTLIFAVRVLMRTAFPPIWSHNSRHSSRIKEVAGFV
jgi:hypothetical protein